MVGHNPQGCKESDTTERLHFLVLQGLRVCRRASLEGGQHLGMPCLFPSLPLLDLGLLLLFSVIKGIGGCLIISSKEAAGSCCCSCFNLILIFDAHGDRNLSLKSPVPHKSLNPDWKTFGGPLLAFPERQWGSHWAPELLLRLGTVPQAIGFLLFPWVDFLRGESVWSVSYPVLLQPESQASLGQGADAQAGLGVTAS